MKKKKLYIFTIIAIILLLVFSRIEKGLKIGTWGMNRSINWGWNFGF